jgi:hypothetical protein
MKIESVLKRDKGTRVDLGGLQYHFEPLEDGAHVAEVTEPAHVDRLLSIPEGYKVYHGKLTPKGEPVKLEELPPPVHAGKKPSGILNGSSQHQAQYEIGGQTYALGDVVRIAFEKSGLSEDEWNALDEDDVAAKLDIVLDDLAEAAEKAAQNPGAAATEADERAALVKLYEAKFGTKPHHKTGVETIRAKLAE